MTSWILGFRSAGTLIARAMVEKDSRPSKIVSKERIFREMTVTYREKR